MMKKILSLMVICAVTSLTSILPVSAQNLDQTDEYKTLLRKIMTLSGSSTSSEVIVSQLMSSMKNGPFQQDEAYWKDSASRWIRKIKSKVMEVYAPTYQQHTALDELKKVVAFYESPVGRKPGETATAVATELILTIQQLSMETAWEMMPKLQKSGELARDDAAEQAETRDQKLLDAAYTAPKGSIETVADRTYEHDMGTKPLSHSIERRKDDTKATFL